MSSSILTFVVNDVSEVVTISAITAGIGYLLGRVIKQLDPKAALICGAVGGGLAGLFFRSESNVLSFLVGLALIILLPARVCARLNHPMSFKACVAVSTAIAAIVVVSTSVFNWLYKPEQD